MQVNETGAIISSFAVTLRDGVAMELVQSRLHEDPRYTVGEQKGRRLTLMSADASLDAAEATFRELSGYPYFEYVDLLASFLDTHQG